MVNKKRQLCFSYFGRSYRWLQILLIFFVVLSLVEIRIPHSAQAQNDYAWVAYNDCAGINEISNTTEITLGEETTVGTLGPLIKFSDGSLTSVTAQFTASQPLTTDLYSGQTPSSGIDAYTTFNGKVNMAGMLQYNIHDISLVDWWVDLTISNLNPNHTYTFATSANRNEFTSAFDGHLVEFSLSGDEGATNASTPGVSAVDDHKVYFNTAINDTPGYVARWTGINPGSDGTIVIRSKPHTDQYAVDTFAGFMLAEESSPNQAPIMTAIGDKNVEELTELNFPATASDDGLPSGTLTYSLEGAPVGASINSSTGLFSWTPSENQGPGNYTFDICVSDGELKTCETITVTVSEVNSAPILDPIGDKSVNYGELLSFTATASDSDIPAQLLSFYLAGNIPTGASITSDGAFTWTPTSAQSGLIYTFDTCVTDGVLDSCETIQVTVTDSSTSPILPSSFYGEIHFMPEDGAPIPGDQISAYLDAMTTASTTTIIEEGSFTGEMVYAIDVGAHSDGSEPMNTTFKLGDRILATAGWASGTNVPLHFHPPNADTGGPYTALLEDGQVTLVGSATDYASDVSDFAWDFDNDGTFTDATISNPAFTFLAEGVYPINLRVKDIQGGEGFDGTDVIVVTLSGLDNQIYNGSEHPVTVSSLDGLYTYEIFYDQKLTINTAPTAAGSYPVTVNILSGLDIVGTLEASLVISPIPISVTADDQTKTVSEDDPILTYQITEGGLLAGDTLLGTLIREAGDLPGNYPILQGTLDNPNYAITFFEGTFTIIEDTKHIIDLSPGWNLVSFNVQPYNTDITNVLSSVDSFYTLVYAWDATTTSGNWKKYDPAVEYGNTLTALDEKTAFWIHMSTSATLDVIGSYPVSTQIPLSTTAGGWNLVGYPAGSSSEVTTVFGEHFTSGAASLIYTYHASDSADPWKLYDPAAPNYGSDLELMELGWGYWIYVTQEVILDIAH